jgi:hypothetical protein
MFWNLGEGAAAAVLRADPNAPIERVLSRVWASQGPKFVETALNNNPSLYKPGMTVGQVIAQYDAKMSSAIGATSKIVEGKGLTADDRSKQFVTNFAGITGPQYVTASDVGEVMQSVTNEFAKKEREAGEISRGQARLSGVVSTDPYNSDHKKEVSTALAGEMDRYAAGVTSGDANVLSEIVQVSDRVAHVPDPVKNAFRATLETPGAAGKASAYGALLTLKKRNTVAFEATGFDAETRDRVKEFESYTTVLGLPPDRAIERIDRARTAEGIALRQGMQKNVKLS